MKLYTVVLVIFLSIGLSGCAPAGTTATQAPTPSAPTSQPPQQPAPATPTKVTTQALPQGTVIAFRRSGGLAGVTDYLVIEASGSARLTRKVGEASWSLAPDEVGQLVALLEQSGFATVESNDKPGSTGADRFEYELTYKGRTVRTVDGAVPQTLVPVLGRLNDLLAKAPVAK